MITIGFIDYFLDEWHANNYPKWIADASGGEVRVCFAYGKVDSPRSVTSAQWCEKFGVVHCRSIAEVVEKADCLCVLSPDDCELHEELSALALASGKRVYIDKTFAPDLPAAKRLFDAARAGGSPCWSSSALRFAREYAGLENARLVASVGPGELRNYSVHQFEPVVMLMGGAPLRVLALPGEDCVTAVLDYGAGRAATVACFAQGAPFTVQASFADKCLTVEVKSDFFAEFIKALVAFYRTGDAPVRAEDTLAVMATRAAAMEAAKRPGEWVTL